jgi:hypothetical protein
MAKRRSGLESSLPRQGRSPDAISDSSEPSLQIDVTPQMTEVLQPKKKHPPSATEHTAKRTKAKVD